MFGRRGHDVAFILLVALLSVAFMWLLLPFYGAVLWAVVLAVLFDPLQQRLEQKLNERRGLAAAINLLICIFMVVIPGSLLLVALSQDVNQLYERINDREFDLSATLGRLHAAMPAPLGNLLEALGMGSFESLRDRLASAATGAAEAAAAHLVNLGQGTARFVIGIGVMLYVLFFLLRDGTRIVATIRRTSPMREVHTRFLMRKFTQVIKATVKGNFIIALIQGTIGGLAFWALGINGALLWGVVMVVLSLLPVIGSALVWVPVAVYLLLTGELARGIILLAVGTVLIGLVDNFLRPFLVGKDIHLPDYLVLVSTLGGLALFGMHGFVVGPLIAALFVSAWCLFHEEGGGRRTGS